MTTSMQLLAPAKVNLGLEILGKRPDGFHDIRTIAQSISLFDHLVLVPNGSGSIRTRGLDIGSDENLVESVVRASARRFGKLMDFDIELVKRIPVAAGLGGGSSDAAAALRLIGQHWDIDPTCTEIRDLAADAGSDVPFFLYGNRALMTGRGDDISALEPEPRIWFVLYTPHQRISSKTQRLYGAIVPSDFTDGETVSAIAQGLAVQGHDPYPNAFARPLYDIYPEFRSIPEVLTRAGAAFVSLSGAGPTHYTAADNEMAARSIARAAESGKLSSSDSIVVAASCGRQPIKFEQTG